MKSRYIFLRVILCVLFPILGNVQAWGGSNNYYAQVTATAIPTGAGTVYASANGQNGETGTTSTAAGYTGTRQGNVSFTFTATPSGIYDFKGWSTANNVNATPVSTNNPYETNYQASRNTGQNNATTNNIYAIFVEKPLFYFSGTATATPSDGGTASVSPATANVRGEHWNSTSATTTAIAFSATANTGYEFLGWSTTANGNIVSTASPYNPTLTSISTNSGSPMNTTYYARFAALPLFYFSATAVSVPAGAGTVSASVADASKYGETSSSTSATTNATFTATPTSQYRFLGWSTTANGNIESTNASYTKAITSTSTDSNNPTNTTLYARFQPYATSITATPTTLKIGNSATRTVTYTLSPADAYHKVTATSSNTGVFTATCDNAGTVTVTAVGTGTATLTLKALNDNDEETATTTVAVKVLSAGATPTFSFDNSTNEVTISSATSGATIYYTTDGTTPTTSSRQYTGPFVQSTACTIKAIAVYEDYLDSEIGTYELVKLAKPFAEVGSDGTSVTFTSTDDGVTFYYNSYDVDNGAPNPGIPTSSSSSWTTGSSAVTVPTNNVLQVITMKPATSTTGYITSDVYIRRVNTTDMSGGDFVFMYDDGTNVHFMANASGSIADATTFNPSSCIWQGEVFANDSEEAHTLLGGALYYEPFIRFSNNGQYLQTFTGCNDYDSPGWEDGKLRVTNSIDAANAVYYYPRTVTGRGQLINSCHFNDQCYSSPLTFQLGYNTSSNQWSRNCVTGVAIYNYDYFAVIYPVEQRGGSNFTLTTTCPEDGSGGYVSLKKGESTTFSATTTGTYNPVYYRVGNEVKYFYYYPNTNTPMTTEPQPTNDIRITYELVNGQGYCELVGNKVTLLYDPGVDRLISVRIIATPYINGVAQTDGIQEDYCYFHILTAPPFPAPVITNVPGTNEYEMTCTAANSEIEYRIGDASEWTHYTGPITVVTPGTVITARSYRGRNTANYELSDPVTYTVGGATLLPPTVTVNENGVVTITANVNNTVAHFGSDYIGETWLYTLDGSEPDPDHVGDPNATKTYNPSTGVTLDNGQRISVIAVDNNSPAKFGHSAVVVAHYKVSSGVDATGVVTLNDYEDHEWSYYQASADLPTGYPDALHSPYPRNVKITYYGYGENTLSTTDAAAPAANTFTTNTTQNDVKVGIDEPGHTFIYYKTLERDANGRYPYELIPNPFYVRPKSGNIYTGFYKWRIKSIGSGNIYDVASGGDPLTVGTPLDAEKTYYFDPSDNAETNVHNAESMTIELEALWAPAEVTTGTSFSKGYNSVERNFSVGRSGTSNNVFGSSTPCTYSSFYPNGTTNGTTVATLADRQSIGIGTAQGNSKVEYYIISGNSSTFTVDNKNVTIGRGVTPSSTYCANVVQGTANLTANYSTNLTYKLRIESGNFHYLSFINGYTDDNGANQYNSNNNNYSRYSYSGSAHGIKIVLGSDYDRSKEDNEKLTLTGPAIMGYRSMISSTNNRTRKTVDLTVKSGKFVTGIGTNMGNADVQQSFYMSVAGSHTNVGERSLTIEGGELANIAGGIDGINQATSINNQGTPTAWANNHVRSLTLRMKGGTVKGSIYGGAAKSPASGDRWMVFTGGTVKGWLGAGCNGTDDDGGQTYGESFVYVGGNTHVGGHTANINGSEPGTVFGAGKGYAGGNGTSGEMSYGTNLAIADNSVIENNAYGGGNYGYALLNTRVYVLGGDVQKNVFGGSNLKNGPEVKMYMTGGLVEKGLYGGSNSTGTITENVEMHIDGGQVGVDASSTANIHGGGFGSDTRVTGNVDITIGSAVGASKYVTIYGDVYGGSAMGLVNGTAVSTTKHTNVTLNAGKIHGSLYGGGLGDKAQLGTGHSNAAANVYAPVQVTVNGGGVHATSNMGSGAVYGCNNVNGAPQSTVKVDIYGTDAPADGRKYALDAVYGGGNQAGYTGSPEVMVHNCDNSIEYVYGGGNAADITGNTTVTIWGGNEIGTVFGGGHGDQYSNPQLEANVTGDVSVTVHGGTIGQVFGGSNSKGTIGGSISVDISRAEEPGKERCKMKIREVYGGGNEADSNAGFIHIGCTGDMSDGEGIVDVYGGANKANVNGNITLDIEGGNINRVFGGNNTSGDITGTITVDIDWNSAYLCRSYYLGSVFGGGNLAAYTAPSGSPNYPVVNIKNTKGGNTKVSGNVFGAGMGDIVDGTKGVVTGNPVVNITGGKIGGDVYGGGSYASVKGYTAVNLVGGSIDHNVYGGGLGSELSAAMVEGNATVLLNGGTSITGATNDCEVKGTIFGCNNVNGSPTGHVLVHVYQTVRKNSAGTVIAKPTKATTVTDSSPGTFEMAGVYGGGNLAAYEPANGETKPYTEVIIDGCDLTSIGYVYGGGNAASVPATSVTVNGAYEIGWLFGGGNGKDALPNGDPNPGANVGYKAYADDATDAEIAAAAYGTGNAETNVYGGTVHNVFGGSNTKGNVRTAALALLDEAGSCALEIDEIYGGGNEAYMKGNSHLKLGCISYLKTLYGGSKKADMGVRPRVRRQQYQRIYQWTYQGEHRGDGLPSHHHR